MLTLLHLGKKGPCPRNLPGTSPRSGGLCRTGASLQPARYSAARGLAAPLGSGTLSHPPVSHSKGKQRQCLKMWLKRWQRRPEGFGVLGEAARTLVPAVSPCSSYVLLPAVQAPAGVGGKWCVCCFAPGEGRG